MSILRSPLLRLPLAVRLRPYRTSTQDDQTTAMDAPVRQDETDAAAVSEEDPIVAMLADVLEEI
jgi:hypothetical protein